MASGVYVQAKDPAGESWLCPVEQLTERSWREWIVRLLGMNGYLVSNGHNIIIPDDARYESVTCKPPPS